MNEENLPTHYETLGVPEDITHDELKKVVRRLQRENHPDLGGDIERSAEINVAADILLDPAARAQYDEELHTPEPEPEAPEDYEENWGEEESWEEEDLTDTQPEDSEEVIDAPIIEEEPLPTPHKEPQPAQPASTTAQSERTYKKTKVKTIGAQWTTKSLIPFIAVALLIFVLSTSETLIWSGIGAVAGLVLSIYGFATNKGQKWENSKALYYPFAGAACVVAGFFFARETPMIAAVGALFGITIAALPLADGYKKARHGQRIYKASSLGKDAVIFGNNDGSPEGVLVERKMFGLLAQKRFHAARGIQVNHANAIYSKGVLLGSRLAVIRPVLVRTRGKSTKVNAGNDHISWQDPSLLYWSVDAQAPTLLYRANHSPYAQLIRKDAPGLTVQEFLVVVTDVQENSPLYVPFDLSSQNSVEVIRLSDFDKAVGDFLMGDSDSPAEWVSQQNMLNGSTLLYETNR